MTKDNRICECGHKYREHRINEDNKVVCVGGDFKYCPCKKFTPKKDNHNQENAYAKTSPDTSKEVGITRHSVLSESNSLSCGSGSPLGDKTSPFSTEELKKEIDELYTEFLRNNLEIVFIDSEEEQLEFGLFCYKQAMQEVRKVIDGLIEMRKKSENRNVSNYDIIFSINDLQFVLSKLGCLEEKQK